MIEIPQQDKDSLVGVEVMEMLDFVNGLHGLKFDSKLQKLVHLQPLCRYRKVIFFAKSNVCEIYHFVVFLVLVANLVCFCTS